MVRALAYAAVGVVVAIAAGLSGCAPKTPKAIPTQEAITRDVHPLLRGTIGAEGQLRGVQPVLVSGFGLVVGLDGTGGDILPESVASTMQRQMSLMGVGGVDAFRGTALEGKTPAEVLRNPNTAVVIVQAAIPPGSPANSSFDVVVRAMNATSLEGGTLWTTELRLGDPAVFGAVQARPIATARGPIFINPFAEDRPSGADGVTRTAGRVLGGGSVTQPFSVELVLDSNSHARARAIVSAINSRFPKGPGDPGDTARGRAVSDAGGSVALRIPRRYRLEPGEFLELVMHLPIDGSFPEEQARRLVQGVQAEPALAEEVSWCLEAIGSRGLPFVRQLYEHPDLAPRMAGLRAGARLNDSLASEPLRDIARTGTGRVRTRAIELLGELDGGPRVDMALRDLLSEPALEVRVAAYEALVERASREQTARLAALLESNPDAPRISPTRLEVLGRARWARRNVQGIRREIVGESFILDIVPFGEPLVYVTQVGFPRIVVFGEDRAILRPSLVSASDDRLLITAEPGATSVRVRYVGSDGVSVRTGETPADIVSLVQFLATSPRDLSGTPGLGMTYSDVVGALAAMSAKGGVRAAFATQADKLKADLLAASTSQDMLERPDRPGDEPIVLHESPTAVRTEVPGSEPPPRIVPIVPPAKK
ncbi:MAG: flagellar basal body P-ring protein FlgI [Planctomycetota bacterium]|nr:flagellar basal body P-ring protein FlgI [Planctomycetota bacterium]